MLPNPIIKIGSLSIYMYGVMIAVGILACFAVLYGYSKILKISPKLTDFVFYNAIAAIAVGFGAAALWQALYNYIQNPAAGFHIGQGITFIGGLLGGAGCFLIVYFVVFYAIPKSREYYSRVRLIDILSLTPCCILIAHAFGRIGCFFAGCCYGKPTDSFLGVKFPSLSVPVHPTQLYEAAFLFIMFGVCSYLLLKKHYQHNMSLYLVSYGIFRFLIEYLRGDPRGSFLGVLSPSQFWSVFMVIGGVLLYIFGRKLLAKRESELAALPPEKE